MMNEQNEFIALIFVPFTLHLAVIKGETSLIFIHLFIFILFLTKLASKTGSLMISG